MSDKAPTHLLFQDALLVTCDDQQRVLRGDLRVREGRIVELGEALDPLDADRVSCGGALLCPGFVQTHVHLCQTLFRGLADDLALMDWLRTRIWPLEAAHDADSSYWSARLGLTELLLGGTTAILDMGTVRHTDATFEACAEAGIRASVGRAMMDRENEAGLAEPTETSLQGACDEADRWHGQGRLRYAFAPRFVPSCTEELLLGVVAQARARGCLIHTHASENLDEVALVRQLTGRDNVAYLHDIGLTGPDVCLAHCIHLEPHEEALLARTGTRVLHCPGSNQKLGSGLARIPELLAQGIHVSLGADGAPCNNRLDIFAEMRLAALLQKTRLGPTAMPAPTVLGLATRAGAEALGLDSGQLAVGRPADLVLLDPGVLGIGEADAAISTLVYAASPSTVKAVWIEGEQVVRDGEVVGWSTQDTLRQSRRALARVRARAGV